MEEDKNGSDKNVGRIENDMKILEEMVEKSRDLREEDFYKLIGIKQMQAISSFIKRYKELEEKWDKDTHTLQNALDLANADKINNYIPVSLVEEKRTKLKDQYNRVVNEINNQEMIDQLIDFKEISAKLEMCEELLEKRK